MRSSVFVRAPSEVMQKKIERACEAVASQNSRYLKCPYCRHNVVQIFDDTAGHVEGKCQKCGRVTVFDVASMRRIR